MQILLTTSSSARPRPSTERIRDAAAQDYPVIATANLRLRAFTPSDLTPLVSAANEHDVADTAISLPYPLTASYARQWMNSHQGTWRNRQAVHWAVSTLADDRFIGYIGLQNVDLENRHAQLNFWLADPPTREEYAVEAAEGALAFAFTTLEMNRLYASHLTRDPHAARVLLRIGMRPEGAMRQHVRKWQHYEDVLSHAILRADWLELF